MTQTVNDTNAFTSIPEEQEILLEESTTTAVATTQTHALSFGQAVSREAFLQNLKWARIRSSYIDVAPKSLDDYKNLVIRVKGCVVNHIKDIDTLSGEILKEWDELRIKIEGKQEDEVIACSGKAALQFSREVLPYLGQGDWPEIVEIAIKSRQLKNGHPMPVFQVLS
jgi:hypothetical protein